MQAQRSAKRAYGSGSIYEHRGSWYGRWRPAPGAPQVKRKLGPKRTRAGADGMTRSQAEARLRELMAIEATPAIAARPRTGAYTVEQLGELYIASARKLGRKESTLTDYAMCVRLHLTPFFGETPIQRIDAKRIEALIVHLQDNGLRPKSVRNYVGTLSALLNFAVRKKWLAASPMTAVDLPALNSGDELEEPLRFLLPSEVHALADAALPGHYHAIDRALYLTAAFTAYARASCAACSGTTSTSTPRASERSRTSSAARAPHQRAGEVAASPWRAPSPTLYSSYAPNQRGLARTIRSSRTP